METAGKIKNDNMSNQDFYKFQFAAISRRGGVTPPYNIHRQMCGKSPKRRKNLCTMI